MANESDRFVSRAGAKLARALDVFELAPRGWVCADLGCSTGGFVDCLLQRGAAKVYAVDRGYGVLAYALRTDERVVVMERTDALSVRLPETVRLVTVDAGWTRQSRILPAAGGMLTEGGELVTLVKPHYEAEPALLRRGVLPDEHIEAVLETVRHELRELNVRLVAEAESPIQGRGGNREFLWHVRLV